MKKLMDKIVEKLYDSQPYMMTSQGREEGIYAPVIEYQKAHPGIKITNGLAKRIYENYNKKK